MDPVKTAYLLVDLCDWQVRWQGRAKEQDIRSCRADTQYLAVYCPAKPLANLWDPHGLKRGPNHIGLYVADRDATGAKVKEMGFITHSHADYAAGRRFYF